MSFSFVAELWEWGGKASWFFVTVPREESDEIADLAPSGPGFGSVKVMVTVGETEWSTSLFPSKELSAYVLPIKRVVRESEGIDDGDVVEVSLHLVGLTDR